MAIHGFECSGGGGRKWADDAKRFLCGWRRNREVAGTAGGVAAGMGDTYETELIGL